jgi:hypothetical protein
MVVCPDEIHYPFNIVPSLEEAAKIIVNTLPHVKSDPLRLLGPIAREARRGLHALIGRRVMVFMESSGAAPAGSGGTM